MAVKPSASAIHEMANELLAESKVINFKGKKMSAAKPVFLNSSMKHLPHKSTNQNSKSPYMIEALLAKG